MSQSAEITGNEKTSPHFPYEVGVSSMLYIVGSNFAKVNFQRKKS